MLKNVSCHYSYHSSEKINKLFQAMFPDSSIASNFQCGETKTAYIAAYGLAPFFKNQLVSQINSLSMPQFVYVFDESLCEATQTKQMDCHVRFWNDSRKLVTRRYLGAQFMGHGDAVKLVDCCHESLRGLHEKNILQISMDGPNVNWKFYEDVCNDIFSDDMSPQPPQLGSCGLHILHGAFKDGMSASGWDLKSLFWSLHQFMKDSPARREDYTEITGSSLFPLKFCVHRWVENVPVVQRAIEITLLMDTFLKTLAKKKETPKNNKLCSTITSFLEDKLLNAEMYFFLSVAKQFHTFLKHYQTDRPMVPFLAKDLESLIRGLMRRCIKSSVLEEAGTILKILKIDISNEGNSLTYKAVDIGFQAEKELKTLFASKAINERKVLDFRTECKAALLKCVMKLLFKCLLNYSVVRNACAFDPNLMATKSQLSLTKFKRLVSTMNDCKRVKDVDCDDVIWQYQKFLEDVVQVNSHPFEMFNSKDETQRLDGFFVEFLDEERDYTKLWRIMRMILVLSHGQASVESGFSVNRQIEEVNLQHKSIEAQRVICDEVDYGEGILNVPLTKELFVSVSTSRQKYQQNLKEKREEKVTANKRKVANEEINKLFEAKKQKIAEVASCKKAADKLARKAEKVQPREAVLKITQSNALGDRAELASADATKLSKRIDELRGNTKSKKM